jgi:tungstate transport system substrate-binding protein
VVIVERVRAAAAHLASSRPAKAFGLFLALGASLIPALGPEAAPGEQFITVASTTSTENSGLFAHILPLFEARTGIRVRVIAVGTGQAIRIARNGDADVLFVHDREAEERFVAEGFGLQRRDVMYNDFVIVGPAQDLAGIAGLKDAVDALRRISAASAPAPGREPAIFVSRGDLSGTHKAELGLWTAAGVDVAGKSGTWYRETGAGMGATLNTAAGMRGYTLTDRGTWLNFRNRGDLVLLAEGDPRLFNPYGVILVNPERHPHVKAELGQAFIDWLTSGDGQAAIAGYQINGEQAFFPNAANPGW